MRCQLRLLRGSTAAWASARCASTAAEEQARKRLRKEQEKIAAMMRGRRSTGDPFGLVTPDAGGGYDGTWKSSGRGWGQRTEQGAGGSENQRVPFAARLRSLLSLHRLRAFLSGLRQVSARLLLIGSPVLVMWAVFYDEGYSLHLSNVAVVEAVPSDATVLEIDCGYAVLTAMLARHLSEGGGSIVAVDKDNYVGQSTKDAIAGAEFVHGDPCHLGSCDALKGRTFSHAVLFNKLSGCSVQDQLSLLESITPFVSDSLVVHEYTPDATGVLSLKQIRNFIAKTVSPGGMRDLRSWQENGGLPELIAAVEEARVEGKLAVPELRIESSTALDGGTSCLYIIKVSGEAAKVKQAEKKPGEKVVRTKGYW
eukprot:TRINITY_DN35707_c0_g1_i1.p1 TRINITY_DN35707_c0_g1~~TRINITY_DN35707_c0_g1_i1.p1  ORF type:complete len:367 (+),score=107.87 TRINITY_DN35707_c0_g1_i1:82-1182(+)